MIRTLRCASATTLLTTMLLLGTEAQADAVTDKMEEAMAECVSANASRIGSPLDDDTQWAKVVAGSTGMAYSMVKLFGTEDYAGLQEAMIARTNETLIPPLEKKGFERFRSQAIQTVEYCMPFALVAAADEMDRQKVAVCPDDTNYVEAVEIIGSSKSDLRRSYGDAVDSIRELSLTIIQLEILDAFPEIFDYGKDEYPVFGRGEEFQQVHEALNGIDLENTSEIRPLVDQALVSINVIGEKSDRMLNLRRELTCIKDWLDIYPAERISRLSKDD